jgi:hypothetical protein
MERSWGELACSFFLASAALKGLAEAVQLCLILSTLDF